MKSSRLGTQIIYLNICVHTNLCDGNYVQYLSLSSVPLKKNPTFCTYM